MSACCRTLSVDLSALPAEPVFRKLFPIVKKRIEDRCGAVCRENDDAAEYTLRFLLDESVPAEGFRLTDGADGHPGVTVSGASFLALMYGAGQFLHKSHYRPEGIVPTDWRGQSVPQCEKRMIFFAQHFYNWYQRCSADEMREHIEDLALWGINGVVSVFSCLNLTGWDDPNLIPLADLFRKTLGMAREMTMKIGMEFSNIDFSHPRTEFAADKRRLWSHTGNLICPSTEGGYAYYQEMLTKVLSYSDDLGGLDFLTIWAYDEGGCSCDQCWPWGGRGFYNMAHRASKYLKARYPKMEIWLATWHFGRGKGSEGEWDMLYQRLQEDAAKGDNWADYLLLETRDDAPGYLYPTEHGQPTKHTKLLTFPDVSMVNITPWGGYGAACTPKLLQRWEAPFASRCNGGYIYTEGLFDDSNKVLMLGMYWDRSRPAEETLRDYCTYELQGIAPEDFIRLVELIETSQSYTNRVDRKPCPLEYSQQAWALAEKMDREAAPRTRACWRWRVFYIRAYLDLVRYRNCAAEGWPIPKTGALFRFWRRFMENDARAQEYLLELIHIYKAMEIDDPVKYAYHWYLRPPMTRGADLEAEKRAGDPNTARPAT